METRLGAFSVEELSMAWLPSAENVHAVIPQRVAGGFTVASIPTVAQVDDMASNVAAEVQAYVGQDIELEAEDEQLARYTASVGTAAEVERGLYPEQSQAPDSNYMLLRQRYRELAAQLYHAVHGVWPSNLIDEIPDADEAGARTPLPAAHFPQHDWVGHRGW